MRGKSLYTQYEKGEFKLVYVKGYSTQTLSNDHNIFIYKEGDVDTNKLLSTKKTKK